MKNKPNTIMEIFKDRKLRKKQREIDMLELEIKEAKLVNDLEKIKEGNNIRTSRQYIQHWIRKNTKGIKIKKDHALFSYNDLLELVAHLRSKE